MRFALVMECPVAEWAAAVDKPTAALEQSGAAVFNPLTKQPRKAGGGSAASFIVHRDV